ncbi:hypothetical protein QN219_14825 [Sinorhizobium sp. 7-81]|uniref:hypothetical protein n=1 Tax=Sinorhizobium sp. 8-89 TaxID=3049089 RepID=UPI0024C27CB0|nr:hypothetical protein [Sinorhizobium sp. 8-89]MDK1491318.1 hypothetical protein [Sinorhizobium sp. 8-89]
MDERPGWSSKRGYAPETHRLASQMTAILPVPLLPLTYRAGYQVVFSAALMPSTTTITRPSAPLGRWL